MLIDSHCHLDFPDFAADGAKGAIARAKAAGVGGMLTISTRISTWDRIKALAEDNPEVWCSVGVHPHQAGEEGDVALDRLLELAAHPRCVGIGESGLDYHYDFSPRDAQHRSFATHIEAARRSGLPLIVHAREADDDIAAALEAGAAKGGLSGVMHCFSSGAELARRAAAIGFYVSFSGILTFKTGEALRAIARELPRDRLLVETDSPYLAPIPHRGHKNEPAFVVETAKVLAETIGATRAEIERLTTDNFHRLFAKARP